MDSQTSIDQITGIGKYFASKLKRLEITSVADLIYHFPFRYDDFKKIQTIVKITPGEKITLEGIVWQIQNLRTRTGKFVTVATVADQSATCEVIWFNQPYLTKIIKAGMAVSLAGKAEIESGRLKLISPAYEILHTSAQITENPTPPIQLPLHTAGLVPIYPETEGISSKWLRAKIAKILPHYLKTHHDYLPEQIIKNQKLIGINIALQKIHFPKNQKDIDKSRQRIAFDELFLTQFLTILRKKSWQETKNAPCLRQDKQKITALIQKLPFALTNAQKKAVDDVVLDLQKTTPMNRLLEGDVGSGKTVVAATAAYIAYLNGYDTIVAAPTEILAFQHQKTLSDILSAYNIECGIWTASKKAKGQITCGTHALLSTFKSKGQVGLVVVDEQHRFGVAQRAEFFLKQSKKLTPHLLTMTATPIPRTLALTLYGDLDLSVLDEMPKGRQKIATFVVPNFKRDNAYQFIEKQVGTNRQAFIITPFVEPSETMTSVKAATLEFGKLKTKFAKNITLGLLHGRLKSRQKETIINQFRKGQIDILVATPVVEVGIDVPNATVMMIESAERFGLAQLHQLRGRVGRGLHKSYCLLFTDSQSTNSLKRLKSMEKVHLGFELAEIDLKIRGPGEIFGLKQSGFANLKIADITNQALIAKAQNEAKKLVEKDPQLSHFPLLKQKISTLQSELSQPN